MFMLILNPNKKIALKISKSETTQLRRIKEE